jgi:hypothetical protein
MIKSYSILGLFLGVLSLIGALPAVFLEGNAHPVWEGSHWLVSNQGVRGVFFSTLTLSLSALLPSKPKVVRWLLIATSGLGVVFVGGLVSGYMLLTLACGALSFFEVCETLEMNSSSELSPAPKGLVIAVATVVVMILALMVITIKFYSTTPHSAGRTLTERLLKASASDTRLRTLGEFH